MNKRLLIIIFLLSSFLQTWADTWTDSNGVTWTYDVSGSEATITTSSQTTGDVFIPSTINGYTVTSIGSSALHGRSGLTSVTIPEGVTSIGSSAFSVCSGLTSVTIPSSVTSIGQDVFSRCKNLTSIVVSTSNTKYDSRRNCNAIIETATNTLVTGCKTTIIPNTVTSIGKGAFFGCSGLTSVTIPSCVTSIGDVAFWHCTGLTSVIIEEGVTSISYSAFDSCTGLTNVTIPSSVTSIGDLAFVGCTGLTSVTIPASVTSIGFEAFDGCTGLTSVYSYMEIPPAIDNSTFSNYRATLYVPEGSMAAYQSADYWKDFKLITTINDTDYSNIDNTIYLEPAEALTGSQMTLSVKMKNAIEVQGYQFDLYLPEGVTVATDEDGFNLIELSTERTTARKTDYFNSTVQADGSIRVLCGSSKGYTFEGNDGEVATITLNISGNMTAGGYPIILKEVNLSDRNSTLYTTDYLKTTLTVKDHVLGDVNGNRKVEVADFIATANYILGNPPQVFNIKAADVNGNNKIEVSDFIGIANIILNGSTSSNAPAAAPKKGPRKAATDISTLTDVIYVEPVTAMPGTQQTLSIQMKNSSPVAGFEFRLQLPEGITVATDDDDILMAELSTERTTARKTDYFNSALQADGTLQVLCGTSTANPNTGKPYTFSGNEGEVARITVNIPEDYADGVYEMSILDAAFSDADNHLTEVGQTVTTELTIGDNTIVLDENSEDDIETTDAAVSIKVRRTIAANQWSTICLPFNMTAEQVYASFGDDVQLQAFDSYDVDYDDDDNVKSILVHFADIDIDEEGFYSNYPYLIKVSDPVEEFTVRSILEPDEESAIAEYDNGKTGRQRKVYGTFYGTYHAQTTVPESCLFISNNKFWYSTGLTKMKAFRGYFEFVDVLSDMANANISFSFDGTTGIREILNQSLSDGAVYTIQGQFVGKDIDLKKLPRGIYIINGKKQVIK